MDRRQFLKSMVCLSFPGLLDNGVLAAEELDATMVNSNVQTGLVLSDRVLHHSLGEGHPESPARYVAIRDRLVRSGLVEQCALIPLRDDLDEWILLNHTQAHIDGIKQNTSAHSLSSAVTGGVLTAVDRVCRGDIRRAFCATRPPGHHALNTGHEEGFCFYNHIAIAARYAQQVHGIERVLIVDWDYHHGNGTEASFYADPTVLYFSTHDWEAYPLTGDPTRRGEGPGEGYTINVHLACGANDADFYQAFDEDLIPATQAFKPELVLISCGFDSRRDDLLGCHRLTDQGYAELTRKICVIADQYASGRVVSVLEGGYGIAGTASASEAHLRELIA